MVVVSAGLVSDTGGLDQGLDQGLEGWSGVISV